MRKRHMKTLIAAVTMSALLVTGCGGKDGSDSKKTARVVLTALRNSQRFLQHLVQRLMMTMKSRKSLQKRRV